MMDERFSRTGLLLGEAGMDKLEKARVAVFGIGGVGGHLSEALARAGIGEIDIIDKDVVDITNINRQLYAFSSTVGRYKVDVAKERILDINPQCRVNVFRTFVLPDTINEFDLTSYDYVADAIDTVTGKLCIIEAAQKAGTPVISAMGAGNKLDPSAFEVTDIYRTTGCPLARVMRRECKKRGLGPFKCVYSKEKPVLTTADFPASVSFVPPVAGLIMAGEIVKDIAGNK